MSNYSKAAEALWQHHVKVQRNTDIPVHDGSGEAEAAVRAFIEEHGERKLYCPEHEQLWDDEDADLVTDPGVNGWCSDSFADEPCQIDWVFLVPVSVLEGEPE